MLDDSDREVWDERLKCHVVSLDYDFRIHAGELFLTDGGCCDRTGCLKLFEAIDPDVQLIDTYSGAKADAVFRKEGSMWITLLPSRA
jgi:hypothetical protein